VILLHGAKCEVAAFLGFGQSTSTVCDTVAKNAKPKNQHCKLLSKNDLRFTMPAVILELSHKRLQSDIDFLHQFRVGFLLFVKKNLFFKTIVFSCQKKASIPRSRPSLQKNHTNRRRVNAIFYGNFTAVFKTIHRTKQ